ncbi:hypothetical protein [Amycolatopsis sp. NBC_01480]|uniref:hypothetical protein n=1 Tax=Amycolatopsis sp. NBC_01480 TaxID=2903562 RepID=UPI002E291935|nr:hypothetical protein [Amycolatopsis sp. NBC_01480]
MTNSVTEEPATAGTWDPRAIARAGDAPSLPGARRAAHPPLRDDPVPAEPATFLHRLSTMASMREWEQQSTPMLIHEAILAGASPCAAARSARVTTAEAHVRWSLWAFRRLGPFFAGEATSMSVQQYLRVHTAFAEILADELVFGEASYPKE